MIADMVDQAVAEGCTAHEAEARAIEQIRKLGQEVLKVWAENPTLIKYGKKTADLALHLRRHFGG